jgi:hypothetical protein
MKKSKKSFSMFLAGILFVNLFSNYITFAAVAIGTDSRAIVNDCSTTAKVSWYDPTKTSRATQTGVSPEGTCIKVTQLAGKTGGVEFSSDIATVTNYSTLNGLVFWIKTPSNMTYAGIDVNVIEKQSTNTEYFKINLNDTSKYFYTIDKTGTIKKQNSILNAINFEGYVLIPFSSMAYNYRTGTGNGTLDKAYIKNTGMYLSSAQFDNKPIYIDSIGFYVDIDKFYSNHKESDSRTIVDDCSTLSKAEWYDPAKTSIAVDTAVSPEFNSIKATQTANQSGGLKLSSDITGLTGMNGLVFWIKTPSDISNATIDINLIEKQSTNEEYFKINYTDPGKLFYTIDRNNGIVKRNSSFNVPDFEGYVLIPFSSLMFNYRTGTGNGTLDTAYIKSLAMYFYSSEFDAKPVYIDSIGFYTDLDSFFTKHKINDTRTILNDCSTTSKVEWYDNTKTTVSQQLNLSPEFNCVKAIQLAGKSGGLRLGADITTLTNASSQIGVVFWMKTPTDITNATIDVNVVERQGTNEEYFKVDTVNANKYIYLIDKNGNMTRQTTYLNAPDFEGYVLIPFDSFMFNYRSAGTGNSTLDKTFIKAVSLLFNTSSFDNKSVYFDSIGFYTSFDQFYYSNCAIKNSSHYENTNMTVLNDCNGNITGDGILDSNMQSILKSTVSKDNKAVSIKRNTAGVESYLKLKSTMPADTVTSTVEGFAFWLKTPSDVSDPEMSFTVRDYQNGSAEYFTYSNTTYFYSIDKNNMLSKVSGKISLSDFEGWVLIPFSNLVFTSADPAAVNSTLNLTKVDQIQFGIPASATGLINKSIIVDDAGFVADLDKFVGSHALSSNIAAINNTDSLFIPEIQGGQTSAYKVGFGYYYLSDQYETSYFNKVISQDYVNYYDLVVNDYAPTDTSPTITTLQKAKDNNAMVWLMANYIPFTFTSRPSYMQPPMFDVANVDETTWKNKLANLVGIIKTKGLWGNVAGFYFEEPMHNGIKERDLYKATKYMADEYNKRILTVFSANEFAPWYWDKGIEQIDYNSAGYITDVGYDVYAAFNQTTYSNLTASLKASIGRTNVRMWYVPLTQNTGGTQTESFCINHAQGLYNMLTAESNPGGMICYEYRTWAGTGNIGMDQMFDVGNPNRWATLENNLITYGRNLRQTDLQNLSGIFPVKSEFEIINGQNQYLSIGQETSSGTPVNILSCWQSRAVVTRNDYNLNAFNIVINNSGNLGWNPAAIYFLNQKATYPSADTGFAILYTQANGMVEPIAFHGDGNNLHDYVSTPGAQSQLSLTFTRNPDLTWKMTANGVEFNMPAGYLADLNPSNIYVSLGMWVGDANVSASYNVSQMSLPN